jgi:hypothetical protein
MRILILSEDNPCLFKQRNSIVEVQLNRLQKLDDVFDFCRIDLFPLLIPSIPWPRPITLSLASKTLLHEYY